MNSLLYQISVTACLLFTFGFLIYQIKQSDNKPKVLGATAALIIVSWVPMFNTLFALVAWWTLAGSLLIKSFKNPS